MTATAPTMPAEKPQSDPLLRVTLSAQLAVLEGATKHCTRCGQAKPCAEFHKHRGTRDGLAQWCKECKKAHALAYRNGNLEKVREKDRLRAEAMSTHAKNAKHKSWRDRNREHVRRYARAEARALYARNPEKYRQIAKAGAEQMTPAYVAKVMRIKVADLTPEILAMKREQIFICRLSRQLKEKACESSKDPG